MNRQKMKAWLLKREPREPEPEWVRWLWIVALITVIALIWYNGQ